MRAYVLVISIFITVMSIPATGFAQMAANKTITQNIAASASHTYLSANLKASGLSSTLSGKGPFTVFAPTDAAFKSSSVVTLSKSPAGLDKSNLQELLTYHIVAGNLDTKAISASIKAGNGKAVVTTLQGAKLTLTIEGGKLIVTDAKGNRSAVSTQDVEQSNGVVHVIGAILARK